LLLEREKKGSVSRSFSSASTRVRTAEFMLEMLPVPRGRPLVPAVPGLELLLRGRSQEGEASLYPQVPREVARLTIPLESAQPICQAGALAEANGGDLERRALRSPPFVEGALQ
jgi:hypothetical protein